MATIVNDERVELSTGTMYALQRLTGDGWVDVNPFDERDGEVVAWALPLLLIGPGQRRDMSIPVPIHAVTGRHRVVKQVSAESIGVRDATLLCEFDVLP